MVDLGRADICVEVLMLSSCLSIPIEGNLQQLFHIFAYLKKHHNTEMVFDPSVTDFDADKFQIQDWSQTVYVNSPRIDHLTCPSLEAKDSLFLIMSIGTTLVTLSQEDI